MRCAKRRCAVEQRRNGLPGQSLVGNSIGFGWHAEAIAGFQGHAQGLPSQSVLRLAAIGVDVYPRERLARKLVGDDLTGGIETSLRHVDRGRSFRIPTSALVTHILQPHRTADGLGEYGRVPRAVVGVVAAVGARTGLEDDVHLLDRHLQYVSHSILHEMGFLRATPTSDIAVLDFDQRAGRTHAGMRLEWPFIFGLDHPGGRLEGHVDIAILLFHHAFAHGRFANVVVERHLVRKRRRLCRPFDFQRLGCLDRIPFLVGNHAEEALIPNDLGTRNVLDRAVVDLRRHRASHWRPDHPAVDHIRRLDVGNEVLLTEHLRCDVLSLDRLTDDFVLAWLLRLRLAGRVQRVANLLVPGELNVEILPTDQLRIGYVLRRIVDNADDAVVDNEAFDRCRERGSGHLDQYAPGFRRRHAHLFAAELNAG